MSPRKKEPRKRKKVGSPLALTNEQWIRTRFPNSEARRVADEAMMSLPDSATMQRHMQCWVDTYASVAVPR